MKISKYLLGVIAISMALFFTGSINVKAEKYTGQAIWPSEFVDNVYIKKIRADGYGKYQQGRFIRRSEDNKFVYCLQPFVEIDNNYVYNVARSDYAAILNISEEQWQKIALYAYYGYGYNEEGYNHSAHKWYPITQVLIWRAVEPTSDIYFTNTLNGTRNDSLFASEIAELESLVQKHSTKPNIKTTTDTLNLGQSYTFTDENGVLSSFTVNSSENVQVNKSGNQLTITPTGIGNASIKFTKTHNLYDTEPVLYYANNTQNVMRVGNLDPSTMLLNFKIIGGKLTLQKLDRDTGEPVGLGDGVLANATYGIYDMADNLITKVVTGEDGKVTSDYLPYVGQYKVKEISSSKGYELDPTEYLFEITETELNPTITVYEQVIKRPIQIHKYYANGETGSLEPEKDIKFEFYNKNNELVVSVSTDENGYATFNLPYGTYTGKQITTTSGYEKVENFTITVNEDSPEVINLSFSNAPITAKLRLVKIDADSKKTINYENVSFKIKDLSRSSYVCQKITYPKQELCEFKTDSNGEFITPYPLMPGKYMLEEITSPKGYLLNQNGVSFSIDENSNIVVDNEYGNYITVEFANKKIMGEVKIEKTGDLFSINNGTFSYETTKLSGIEFSIYANEDITTLDGITHFKKGDLVDKVITDINGSATFKNLYLGSYIVRETKTLSEYVLDEKEYEITLTEIDNKTAIVSELLKVNNKLKKGDMELYKTDLITGEPIPNTGIEVYTENNELVFSGKTDENGKVIIKNLKVGKYFIIEVESATGFVLTDEIVYFEIKDNGEIVKAEMTNKPITGVLEFSKIDFSDGTPLPNTLIEIFTEDDELVFSGRTDENGMIVIEELRFGKYYILEKEAPEGYVLNDEKMYFEILEDGEIVKATMVNEKVVIEVPNTDTNASYLVEIIGSSLIICGIGAIIYVIKKKKRK